VHAFVFFVPSWLSFLLPTSPVAEIGPGLIFWPKAPEQLQKRFPYVCIETPQVSVVYKQRFSSLSVGACIG